MAPIQGIMADVMRMRKFLMLITSVELKFNKMAPIKIILADIMRICAKF